MEAAAKAFRGAQTEDVFNQSFDEVGQPGHFQQDIIQTAEERTDEIQLIHSFGYFR